MSALLHGSWVLTNFSVQRKKNYWSLYRNLTMLVTQNCLLNRTRHLFEKKTHWTCSVPSFKNFIPFILLHPSCCHYFSHHLLRQASTIAKAHCAQENTPPAYIKLPILAPTKPDPHKPTMDKQNTLLPSQGRKGSPSSASSLVFCKFQHAATSH